jgi:hypothetical protein
MILLGKSLKEILEFLHRTSLIPQSAKIGYVKFHVMTVGEEDIADIDESEKEMDMVMDGGSSFGGYPYIVENDEADFLKMVSSYCPDIRISKQENEKRKNLDGFDVSFFLDEEQTVAIFIVISNNAGGNMYLVPRYILDMYPESMSYIDTEPDEEFDSAINSIRIDPI